MDSQWQGREAGPGRTRSSRLGVTAVTVRYWASQTFDSRASLSSSGSGRGGGREGACAAWRQRKHVGGTKARPGPGAARRGAGAPETAGLRDVWGRRVGVRGLYRGVWGSGRGALWGDRRTARVPTGPPGPACRPRGARGPGSACPDVDTATAETGCPSAFGGRCLDAHCLNEFP